MEIPVVDPREISTIVRDDDDWRARYDALREAHPFFRVGDDPTIWFTRYDAAREMFTNGELFWDGAFADQPRQRAHGWSLDPAWDRESAEEGVQRHVAVRQVLMQKFAPSEAAVYRDVMRSRCNELIDRFIDRGRVEFIHEFSRAYFPYFGADMLGAPKEDWDMLVDLEHEVFKIPADAGMLNLDNPAMRKIIDYVTELREAKRRKPDDRFVSWVLAQEASGALTETEGRWISTLFVIGSGHTVAAHLGYLFRHFADRPDLQARICAAPEGVPALCEEMLRLYSLGGHSRTVTQDVEFHGCPLKKGDVVFVNYSMVNRDPRAAGFDHVDFERKVNKHLAFNQGWRQCIGLHFGRQARNIAVQEWHKRIPRYRLDTAEPLVEQVYAGVGYHQLPLAWDRP